MYVKDSDEEIKDVPSVALPFWKKLVLGIIIILVPASAYGFLAKFGYIQQFLTWAGSIGLWGNFMIICFIIFTSFPWAFGTQITSMACGFLYRWWLGCITVLLGVALGLSAAFLILRHFFREKIIEWIGKGRKMQFIITSINQEPIKFGLLIRALPLTTGIQTSILSLTNIGFNTFLWTSLAAEMPQHLLYIYLGSQISDLTQILSGDVPIKPEQMFLLVLQIIAAVAVFVTVINMSRKAFQKLEDQANKSTDIIV